MPEEANAVLSWDGYRAAVPTGINIARPVREADVRRVLRCERACGTFKGRNANDGNREEADAPPDLSGHETSSTGT